MKTATSTTLTEVKTYEYTSEEIERILISHANGIMNGVSVRDTVTESCNFDINSGGLLRGATVTVTHVKIK